MAHPGIKVNTVPGNVSDETVEGVVLGWIVETQTIATFFELTLECGAPHFTCEQLYTSLTSEPTITADDTMRWLDLGLKMRKQGYLIKNLETPT